MKTPIILNGEHLPKPPGPHMCDFCFEDGSASVTAWRTWDELAIHIQLVHNDNGRKKSFYNGEAPAEILNHPDWTVYEDE